MTVKDDVIYMLENKSNENSGT